MKTKILSLIVFAVLFNCKKKEPVAPPVEKEPINISKIDFAVLAAKHVDKNIPLPEGRTHFVLKTGYVIKGSDADGARVKNFPRLWKYNELKQILIQYPLSVQNICKEGSQIEVSNLEEFLTQYGPEDGMFQVWPNPKYLVTINEDIFLLGYDRKSWRTRQQAK